MKRRTGLLGGTFDPVHNGHIALARAAADLCALDEVLLIPAAVPPHKADNIARFTHRQAMLERALAAPEHKTLSCLPVEKILAKPSFTIDTLRYLQRHSDPSVDFYFITGADSFLDLPNWKENEQILKSVHFIVFSRSGVENERLNQQIKRFSYKKKHGGWYNHESRKWIFSSFLSLPPVSSSEIRKRVAECLPLDGLVPPAVAGYIIEHSLYKREKSLMSQGVAPS